MQLPKKLAALNNKHFLALTGNVVISVVSVLTISLLLHTMAKADVGMWFFFLSINGLADALRNGFLSTGTIKFYAGVPKERADEVLGSVWFLGVGMTMALVLLNLCAVPFTGIIKSQQAILVIEWFGATVLSSLPYNVAFWILLADEDYLSILWLRLLNGGSMIIILAVMAYLGKLSLQNLLLINFLTNCLTSLAAVFFRYAKVSTAFRRTKKTMLELTNFGKYSMATNLSSSLLGNSDAFIITAMLGPAALAIFNVPLRLMEVIEVLLRTFVGTGMSGMAIAYNNGNMGELLNITKKYAGMLTLLFIPMAIGAFFLADIPIAIYAGKQYVHSEAANIFRILMVMAIFYPIDRFNGVTLDILHKPQVNFQKVIIMIVVNVAVTMGGIYVLKNIYGAAITSPIPIMAGLGFGYYQLKKILPGYSIGSIMRTGYVEGRLLIRQTWAKISPAKV
jgi:O-antigen/teichoic acid export membrane protein